MTTAPERTATPDTGPLTQEETIASLGRYAFGWADPDEAGATARLKTFVISGEGSALAETLATVTGRGSP